jgi:hypothetical protein
MLALNYVDIMRTVWPRHTAKHAAKAADGPVATAKAWLQGRYTPSAHTWMRMIEKDKELRAELARMLGEFDGVSDQHGRGAVPALSRSTDRSRG